jgi:hypothetical protein
MANGNLIIRRHHQYRNIRTPFTCPELPDKLDPVQFRHHVVNDHKIRNICKTPGQSFLWNCKTFSHAILKTPDQVRYQCDIDRRVIDNDYIQLHLLAFHARESCPDIQKYR